MFTMDSETDGLYPCEVLPILPHDLFVYAFSKILVIFRRWGILLLEHRMVRRRDVCIEQLRLNPHVSHNNIFLRRSRDFFQLDTNNAQPRMYDMDGIIYKYDE